MVIFSWKSSACVCVAPTSGRQGQMAVEYYTQCCGKPKKESENRGLPLVFRGVFQMCKQSQRNAWLIMRFRKEFRNLVTS